MTHKAPWSALLAPILLAALGAAHAEPAVLGVRLGLDQDRTRLVLDLSAPVTAEPTLLSGPDRLVLDLPTVAWKLPDTVTGGGLGLVKGYRFSTFDAKTSRIVFDLAGPSHIVRSFSLAPVSGSQHRLVFDLAKGTAAAAKPEAKGGDKDADARVPLPVRKPKQLSLTVMIDPGHGGVDSGTISPGGDTEKTIVLDVARKLKDILRKRGYKVVMTRNSDVYPSLKERVAMARSAKADLFISLHADSNSNHELRGVSVYTLSDVASDSETAELASKENRSDAIAGVDLSGESDDLSWILIELTMRETMKQSSQFARLLTAEFTDCAPMLRNPHRYAGFRVLKAPDVPSVLVELGQLGNAEDGQRLIDAKSQSSMAEAMGRAIDRFFAIDRRAALK